MFTNNILSAVTTVSANPAAVTVGSQSLLAEDFLEQHYVFRRNVLRGMVEYRKIEEEDSEFRPLTQEALNGIFLTSKKCLGEKPDITSDIKLIVASDIVEEYDPINAWLKSLPQWDGKDRVVDFWKRVPGLSAEQIYLLSIWMRSVVAHWMGKDTEHGNECVPVLISNSQGTGKSTFFLRMLPLELRIYFLDHINLANKFDKDMALTNALIVNLDEIDQFSASQMAGLKQVLSKVNVNGRLIYGRTMTMKRRYASFTATTNNRHPLSDPTGSRRFICVEIPQGQYVDDETEIEYQQLYAQLYHEVELDNERYWFNNEEVRRIQQLNAPFEKEVDLQQMIQMFYAVPAEGETPSKVTTQEIRSALKAEFPNIKDQAISSERIGHAMRQLSFEKQRGKKGMYYSVVLRSVA